MNETPQAYIARLLGYTKGKNSLTILKTTPKKIEKVITNLSLAALRKKSAPNKWSICEIISHLAETELVLGWRYRMIAEKNGVMIQPFEQDDWAKNSRYEKLHTFEMLEMYRVLRAANLKFIFGLPKKKFKNYGMHQERGKETIAHLINLEAGHDLNHFQQITKIIKSLSFRAKREILY